MITHSIKTPGFIQSIVNKILPPRQPPHLTLVAPPDKAREYWDKIVFTKWIENVKLGFKKGDLLTFSANGPQPDIIPVHWKLAYLEEVYTLADYDQILEEPRVLVICAHGGGFLNKCPRVMRVLNKEEMDLVNLSNQVPQGHC